MFIISGQNKIMAIPTSTNGGWKLLRNERLPATILPFWNYDSDSWSWAPREYTSYGVASDNASTLTRDYNYWIRVQEPNAAYPLITARGGISGDDINSLTSNSTYAYPDLKSETKRSRELLNDYWKILYAKGMIPRKVAY